MKLEQIDEQLYQKIRAIVISRLRRERLGHTLTPTAVANEVYLRLADRIEPKDEGHVLALAAKQIRWILIDYARERRRRLDGRAVRVTLDSGAASARDPAQDPDVLALHEALEKLAKLSRRQAGVLEMRYFGGWPVKKIASAMGVTERTVSSDFRVAKAWLGRELAS